MGHGSRVVFAQKMLNTQQGVGRCTLLEITHGEMGKHVERVFKKNSLKLNAASHNNTSSYIGTDGFLERSPSGGSLYYKGPALLLGTALPGFRSCNPHG